MPRRWRFWLAGLGALLFVLGFVLAPGYTCSDAGYHGDPDERPDGIWVVGIENGALAWTPDGGINTCLVGLGLLATPLGALLVLVSFATAYRT